MDSSLVPAKFFWEWHGGGELHKALLMTYHKNTERGSCQTCSKQHWKDLYLGELREGERALAFLLPA